MFRWNTLLYRSDGHTCVRKRLGEHLLSIYNSSSCLIPKNILSLPLNLWIGKQALTTTEHLLQLFAKTWQDIFVCNYDSIRRNSLQECNAGIIDAVQSFNKIMFVIILQQNLPFANSMLTPARSAVLTPIGFTWYITGRKLCEQWLWLI